MKLTVSQINKKASENLSSFILDSEKRYLDEINSIVDVLNEDNLKKIIMIAGPSGSGKTTTAHILCDKLSQLGKRTCVVSLDDFYLNREDAPLDFEGNPDFETVYSLDIEEIGRCFKEVIENGVSMMPVFDFVTGKRKTERKRVDISGGGLLIVEGLHALNPLLSEHLPKENIYKIYISVSTYIYDDDMSVLLSSRQMRLIRRMSRDNIYRNTTPQQTYDMWERVFLGEQKYLYGFKSTADKVVATLHDYEPCVFKNSVLGLLSQISEQSEDYNYVESTIRGLQKFISIDESAVPQTSLIREFIRGGKYENNI